MDGYSAYQSAELASVYDAVYASVEDAGFWLAMAADACDGPLLDLGCGTGRVLMSLARAGYEITGVDLSESMLDRCRANLAAEPAEVRDRVTLVSADMTTFELGCCFAAIFCPFNTFHHLRTADEQVACLDRCRAHLLPDGILVLDLFNPDPAPSGAQDTGPSDDQAVAESVDVADGRRIRKWMSACDYNRSLQCNDCEMTYEIIEADGAMRQLTETFPLRLVYRYELEHLLARCGFQIVALYGDYVRSPFADDAIGMIAVAKPPGV